MNKKRDRISVGGASIILIMLVLALSSFALLAIRSSMNEKRLASKTAKSIQEYYQMDAEAEEIYAKIDGIVKNKGNLEEELSKIPEVTGTENGDMGVSLVTYSVKRGERSLYIEVAVNEDSTEIIRWSTKTASEDGLYEIQITD